MVTKVYIDHSAELAKLVKNAEDELQKACNYADDHSLEFSWSPAYGMGGYYTGKPKVIDTKDKALAAIKAGQEFTEEQKNVIIKLLSDQPVDADEWSGSTEAGWNSSSNNC